jgi:hypothetical protein
MGGAEWTGERASKIACDRWEWRPWSRSRPQNLPGFWSGHNTHNSPNLLGKSEFHLPAERWNFLPCSAWGKNSNNAGLPRDLGEGLSDRKPIDEAEESEVGMVEPRILPNQIQETVKNLRCLLNNHHNTALFDENRIWNHEFYLRTSNYIISSYELVNLQHYATNH